MACLLILTFLGFLTQSSSLVTNLSSVGAKIGRVSAGPIEISSLGCGTWSWGNKLLWDYDPSQDEEIYSAYRAIRDAGVTIFDTADSYGAYNVCGYLLCDPFDLFRDNNIMMAAFNFSGTLELNGRAEILLGKFERRYLEEKTNNSSNNMFSVGNLFGGDKNERPSGRNKQQVATKFAPYPWRVTRGSLVQAARESLKRLDQDKLCVAQLHWSTANYQPFQEGKKQEGFNLTYLVSQNGIPLS
mmetsp:Transcript_8519/g.17166  ORF Transcript_8519/g.17166 Transcript_8519/m.17166 type:complete len:243 (+) Transcript_8519:154-882(+)